MSETHYLSLALLMLVSGRRADSQLIVDLYSGFLACLCFQIGFCPSVEFSGWIFNLKNTRTGFPCAFPTFTIRCLQPVIILTVVYGRSIGHMTRQSSRMHSEHPASCHQISLTMATSSMTHRQYFSGIA